MTILITCLLDNVRILLGEVSCRSLLEVKWIINKKVIIPGHFCSCQYEVYHQHFRQFPVNAKQQINSFRVHQGIIHMWQQIKLPLIFFHLLYGCLHLMVEGQSFHLTIHLWPDKDQNNMTKLFYTCFKLYFIDYYSPRMI